MNGIATVATPPEVARSGACAGAWDGFFETNSPWLVRHFTRLTGDAMLAEDLVQDAAVVLIRRFRQGMFRQQDNPKSYFFGVARRLHLGRLRKLQRQATDSVAEMPESAERCDNDEVADRVERDYRQRWLLSRISRLPRARDRALLTRLAVCEQDKASICEALELSARHYDRVLSRALVRLNALP